MNFIYVIHLMCWNYLIDLITHNRNRNRNRNSNNRNNTRARPTKGCARLSVRELSWQAQLPVPAPPGSFARPARF